jgi:hypothetical protein
MKVQSDEDSGKMLLGGDKGSGAVMLHAIRFHTLDFNWNPLYIHIHTLDSSLCKLQLALNLSEHNYCVK